MASQPRNSRRVRTSRASDGAVHRSTSKTAAAKVTRTVARKATGKVARGATKKSGKTSTRSPASPREKAASHKAPSTRDKAATGLRVRMYRVGFGDFFLVSVPAAKGYQHILIDCGVHAKDTGSIVASVKQMAEETNHRLALVIVTHRHADHISGFARCKEIFETFTVDRVWMSWFEDPRDKKAKASQAKLAMAAMRLGAAFADRNLAGDQSYQHMVMNITGGGLNQSALDMLHGFTNRPPVDYYAAGATPTLPASLVATGLKASILGPPTDPALIRTMSNSSQEYLALAEYAASGSVAPFAKGFNVPPEQYDSEVFASVDRNTLQERIKSVQPDLLVAAAVEADRYLNNQSLVVLFTFKGKSLLFAGDAQWGNWANFLYGSATSDTLTKDSAALLAKLDFYKVGHHGSRNATPKAALQAMRDGCVAMFQQRMALSTACRAYPC